MAVICEDLPELENRVELDPDLVDSSGIPAPKVTYRMGENSTKMIERRGGVSRATNASASSSTAATPEPLSSAPL